jgi:eukaryotic-like serine/threonine-protein kinase
MTEPLGPDQQPAKYSDNTLAFPIVRDHELIRLIGSGSSGQVWLAKNALGSYRAVKVVYERSFRHRRPFEREFNGVLKFEPVSRLHEGLVDILQVGRNEEAGYFYCIMELADDATSGQSIIPESYSPRTLARDIARLRKLPVAECVELGAAISFALSFLHKQGLIHRDIKPSNIIFVNGVPKLADIGLVAEMSEARSYVGTEGFIPPEGPGTVQADIYSLGKVLYEISTGKDRNDYPELPTQLGDSAEERDLVKFNKIVVKACRANSQQRFKSAEEMLNALLAFQFSTDDPEKEKVREKSIRIIGISGLVVAVGVITTLIWRLIWLLTHRP